MMQNETDVSRRKGVIYMDADLLRYLQSAVTSDFREDATDSIARYLEILPFLAKNGYKIIIPEMVAYEAATMLATGKDIDAYFPQHDDMRKKTYGKDLKKFIKDVINKKYPNIEVIPTIAPPEVSGFLGRLRDVVEAFPDVCPEANRQLIAIQKSQKKDFGEKAIDALLDERSLDSGSEKTFVLSNDRDGLRALCQRHPDIAVCNIKGLLGALASSKLNAELGIKQNVDIYNQLTDIAHQSSLSEGQQLIVTRAMIDYMAENYLRYNQHEKFNGTYPMARALLQLTREIEQGQNRNLTEANTDYLPVKSGMDKFLKKYGQNWRKAVKPSTGYGSETQRY